MGCEFAQGVEWNSANTLDWYVLDYPLHQGIKKLVEDLNKLYHSTPALYRNEFDWQGFEWVDCHDSDQSALSFLRKDGDDFVLVVVNFTPVARQQYRLGVPRQGHYQEIFNTDSMYYGGSNMGNGGGVQAENITWMNQPCSISITLPPLATIVLALAK